MDALQAIEQRKSVRRYAATPVEDGKLEAVLKAAGSAPKAGAFHIAVTLNPDLLREINDKTLAYMRNSGNAFLVSRANLPGYQPLYGAPVLLLFSAPAENPYGVANASNAATSAAIAATAVGLGSCYVGSPILSLAEERALFDKLPFPEGFRPLCGLLLGYGEGEAFAAPKEPFTNIAYCR